MHPLHLNSLHFTWGSAFCRALISLPPARLDTLEPPGRLVALVRAPFLSRSQHQGTLSPRARWTSGASQPNETAIWSPTNLIRPVNAGWAPTGQRRGASNRSFTEERAHKISSTGDDRSRALSRSLDLSTAAELVAQPERPTRQTSSSRLG